jgi:hypothetical protein
MVSLDLQLLLGAEPKVVSVGLILEMGLHSPRDCCLKSVGLSALSVWGTVDSEQTTAKLTDLS